MKYLVIFFAVVSFLGAVGEIVSAPDNQLKFAAEIKRENSQIARKTAIVKTETQQARVTKTRTFTPTPGARASSTPTPTVTPLKFTQTPIR